jgi:hypothetical protein
MYMEKVKTRKKCKHKYIINNRLVF